MDLKDKLNLLWKYLLLVVIVIAIFTLGRTHGYGRYSGHGHRMMSHHGYCM